MVRAGVRYSFSPSWNMSIAAEGTETRFVLTPELRNNRSVAPLLGFHYDRPRFFANIYAGYRIGQPLGGSTFPAFQTPTGSGFLTYVLTRRVELSALGWRRLVYGSSASDPYYVETRYGGGVTLHVLSNLSLNGYGNYGTNDYSLANERLHWDARADGPGRDVRWDPRARNLAKPDPDRWGQPGNLQLQCAGQRSVCL